MMREIRKREGASFFVQPFHHLDSLSILYAISHPALTPTSRGLLCLHLVGGLSNDLLVPHGQSVERWKERLSRALRGLSISISSDVLSFRPDNNDRENLVLDTLYRSITLCNRLSLTDIRLYLEQLFHTFRPHLFHVAEGLGFWAWYTLEEGRRYATLFDLEIRHQQRSKWNNKTIERGLSLLQESKTLSYEWGPQTLRASILAMKMQAASYEQSPWEDILRLQLILLSFDKSSEQLLAYIEALGHTKGPEYVLPIFQDRTCTDYRWIHAQAQLLKQLGRKKDALILYQHALHYAPELEQSVILNDMVDLQ
ncbi:MAG: hypothetical protein CL916_14165 [Deltaproteobacteria bacterium]|nr:hypothetical protein [Deltaproteobacteria bacterium]